MHRSEYITKFIKDIIIYNITLIPSCRQTGYYYLTAVLWVIFVTIVRAVSGAITSVCGRDTLSTSALKLVFGASWMEQYKIKGYDYVNHNSVIFTCSVASSVVNDASKKDHYIRDWWVGHLSFPPDDLIQLVCVDVSYGLRSGGLNWQT